MEDLIYLSDSFSVISIRYMNNRFEKYINNHQSMPGSLKSLTNNIGYFVHPLRYHERDVLLIDFINRLHVLFNQLINELMLDAAQNFNSFREGGVFVQ